MTERRSAWLTLGFGLAALYSLIFLLVSRGVVARAPALVGTAATVDLTLTAALATWWLGARRGRLPRRAPFVVLALGFVAARLILPANAREGLIVLRVAWGAAELGVMALVIAQLGKIRRRARVLRASGAASIDALDGALAPAVGPFVARLLAFELTVMGYAFGGWRAAPNENEKTFSMHRRAHYGAVIGVFVFLILAETAGLHVVLAHWSRAAAWISTASSIWLALWLIGDAHALRLQPLVLATDGVLVRAGVRWRAFLPYDAIENVSTADDSAISNETLSIAVLRQKDIEVVLNRPLKALGPFGKTKMFSKLILSVDRPNEFISALNSAKRS